MLFDAGEALGREWGRVFDKKHHPVGPEGSIFVAEESPLVDWGAPLDAKDAHLDTKDAHLDTKDAPLDTKDAVLDSCDVA